MDNRVLFIGGSSYGGKSTDYILRAPTPGVPISRYREREWVPYILQKCSDQKKAFGNWMNESETQNGYDRETSYEIPERMAFAGSG